MKKVAFIGAGFMSVEHIKAFKSISNVELSGIQSRTFSKSESVAQQFGIKGVFGSIKEMYDSTHADIVVVSVSVASTLEICKEIFQFPWTILIEKPAGHNLSAANSIFEMAKANIRNVFVAFNRRQYSSTRSLISALENDGEKRFVSVLDQQDIILARKTGHPELVLQNWMFANSVHLIDYLLLFCRGEVLSVDTAHDWSYNHPEIVISKVTFTSGDVGLYQAVWNRPGPWAVSVTTKNRRWEMRPLEQLTTQAYGSRVIENIEIDKIDLEYKAGLRYQAEELIKASDRKKHNLPNLEDSLRTMNLVAKIYGK
jgi:predicted dehydrogenase